MIPDDVLKSIGFLVDAEIARYGANLHASAVYNYPASAKRVRNWRETLQKRPEGGE